ncbi:zf-ZPR1-domain-containing protein [Gloeophyllum trabeum ATCC 11539]|uniref:Zf-ZPR1-domain-containing protein n=1 Tax=Gloeophyllum trabeum (strain ATCC 11539 / FP-39264 / Madison 617) TaxID=670483 RepID=S7RTG8_GLOTA|nr:zf-ZPR1-domain-containing protein [Gloeophyllum trabeum ATCC 11539]EPQ56429.1 zf-ZPR1-domain-containing protein [Gloeophyllum trabeum ATCC 11539]
MPQPSEFFPPIGSVVEKTRDEGRPDDDDVRPVDEIESLCMNCEQQGITRMLLTSIPYFREVIVMSFHCDHCGFHNNEIQSAGTIRPEGTVYTARILTKADLDRQLVKAQSCSVIIPEFELTIPPARGQLTTVEGLLRDIVADLSFHQPLRRAQDEAAWRKIQDIIDALSEILGDNPEEEPEGAQHTKSSAAAAPDDDDEKLPRSITVKLDDPAGNSFIEFLGSMADPRWNLRTYHRTKQQNIDLGLIAPDDGEEPAEGARVLEPFKPDGPEDAPADANEEIYVFPGTCSSCGHHINTMMKKVNIPYFKEILIMSTNCDKCGYRDNEVKAGSAISEKGKKITLKVEDKEDLSRDILKSETCGLTIPEIDLVLQAGTLGGRFTTLEGILDQVYEELSEKVFDTGEATVHDADDKKTFETFLKNLKAIKAVERPFTLILDDPLANSYLQNLYAPDPDPNMTVETYDRTWEQNEELGLNDMKVEGYENDPANEATKEQATPASDAPKEQEKTETPASS